MASDRNWMHCRIDSTRNVSWEYKRGVETFVSFALEHSKDSNGMIRCPCIKCKNLRWKTPNELRVHLYQWGIIDSYTIWDLHGESYRPHVEAGSSRDNIGSSDENMYDASEMLRDIAGQHHEFENMSEEPNEEASQFYKMLDGATIPIYPGNTKYTKLSFITKLLTFKNNNGCSQKGFTELLELIGDVFPKGHTLPADYYEVKKFVKGLNLGYERIDACENDCMLFYKGDIDKLCCDICGASRFKEKSKGKKKAIAKKILRYFPLTPRLQRLYLSRHTAQYMRWHSSRTVTEGELTHPADGDEWKQFDKRFPSFAHDARNVRLGLATDGFNPFSNAFATTYTIWPIIVVVYNLPPSMCMKDPYMFMPLLIPGEKSPTRDINIY